MTTHNLKLEEEYFNDVKRGVKKFEIRKEDDKTYSVGDILILHLWSDAYGYMKSEYPILYEEVDESESDTIEATIVYKTSYAQKDNYVVLGIDNIVYVNGTLKEDN